MDMIRIKLNQGKETIVDDIDEKLAKSRHWIYGCGGRYVGANVGRGKQVLLHRLIMQTPKGMHTDHINGNQLDNRRCNLRICSPSENQWNSRKFTQKTSKYKGVCWYKRDKSWQAEITVNRKPIYLGRFRTEEEAAQRYNKEAVKRYGSFACLNDV